jgi:hypothetical protein
VGVTSIQIRAKYQPRLRSRSFGCPRYAAGSFAIACRTYRSVFAWRSASRTVARP